METTNRVLTKHGFKARMVTPEQEAALDNMAAAPTSYGCLSSINVLNESFANTLYVHTMDGVHRQTYLIAQDGSVARVA
jgi:peroxiredoxin